MSSPFDRPDLGPDSVTIDLDPPERIPHDRRPVYQAVLLAWATTNKLPANRLLGQRAIMVSIAGRTIFYWRSFTGDDSRPRYYLPAGTNNVDRAQCSDPLILAPDGILIGKNTCGHTVTIGRGTNARPLTCTTETDPRGRHPGPHRAGAETWFNAQRGDLAYRDGRPDLTGLPPTAQHDHVLAALTAREQLVQTAGGRSRPGDLAGLDGRRRILKRHEPVSVGAIVPPMCTYCSTPTHTVYWSCIDYREAAAGLVTGLDPA